MRYADDKAFVDFGYVPVARDGVFDVCDVKVVVFYVALFDEVVCHAGYVVAVVDVCKFVYLGQTLFAKGVYYYPVPVLCCSGYLFYQGA